MARDRMVTRHKLDRVESALDELLACADVEFATVFRRARRAVVVLRQWHEGEVEAGDADDSDTAETLDGPRALPAGTGG